jgi:hypothetical protein
MRLRVLDFAPVPALTRQVIHHGAAHALKAGDDPVLTIADLATAIMAAAVVEA